jgi:glycosyltransferase involved in cell wall biosynthesis
MAAAPVGRQGSLDLARRSPGPEPPRHERRTPLSTAAVVLPCFDEAKRLDGPRLLAFLDATPAVSLVLVDDGSRDATGSLLRDLEAKRPGRIDVVVLPENRGKAEAVRQGVLRALARAPTYVGYWDADLATPLELIPAFARLLDDRPEIELVMGARVALLGRTVERRALRHYVGRVGATLIANVLRLPVYDTQCGAKLLRVAGGTAARLFQPPFAAGWTFDVELIARLIRDREARGLPPAAAAIYEYPLPAWRDVPGSKVRPLDYLRSARDLWRVHRRYLSRAARSGAPESPTGSR